MIHPPSSPSHAAGMLEAVWPIIHAEMRMRRQDRHPLLNHMQDVQGRYNGDWAVPYPRKDRGGPELPALGPAIIADTIDATGMAAGSVIPEIFCPSLESGTKVHDGNARKRKHSLEYVWAKSGFKLLGRKWFRQLAGYGTFGISVVPDLETGAPRISAVDPLAMFPEERAAGELRAPASVGVVHMMHRDNILRMWPHARKTNDRDNIGVITPDGPAMWDVVEWVDANQRVYGLLGPRESYLYPRNRRDELTGATMGLHWADNPVGRCTMLVPERVTLEKVVSQVQHILGMTDLMSRLMALDILSSERSIFPDRVITGQSNNPPQLVDGVWHDGIDGRPNIILNAEQVMTMNNSPDVNVKMAVDRLERNAKVSGGLVPQQVGETPGGGLRTGRANDAIYSSAVEPRLQEMHEIMEYWAVPMNEIIIDTYKAYWPSKKYEVFSGQRGMREIARFTPLQHLDSNFNAVSYAIPGASSDRVTVQLAQMYGAGAIAMRDFRNMHPNIMDPQGTEDMVNREAVDESLRRFVQTGIENQTIVLEDLIVLNRALEKGKPLLDAYEKMVEEAELRQQKAMEEQQAQSQLEAGPGQTPPPPLSGMPGPNPAGADFGSPGTIQAPPEMDPNGSLQPGQTVHPSPNQAGLFNLIGATQKGMQ